MNFIDYKRKSPLYYAIIYMNMTILAFFVEKDSKQNPLHEVYIIQTFTKQNICSGVKA